MTNGVRIPRVLWSCPSEKVPIAKLLTATNSQYLPTHRLSRSRRKGADINKKTAERMEREAPGLIDALHRFSEIENSDAMCTNSTPSARHIIDQRDAHRWLVGQESTLLITWKCSRNCEVDSTANTKRMDSREYGYYTIQLTGSWSWKWQRRNENVFAKIPSWWPAPTWVQKTYLTMGQRKFSTTCVRLPSAWNEIHSQSTVSNRNARSNTDSP